MGHERQRRGALADLPISPTKSAGDAERGTAAAGLLRGVRV
jgi:hypothetical protein